MVLNVSFKVAMIPYNILISALEERSSDEIMGLLMNLDIAVVSKLSDTLSYPLLPLSFHFKILEMLIKCFKYDPDVVRGYDKFLMLFLYSLGIQLMDSWLGLGFMYS